MSPPPIQGSLTITASKKKAKASVAMATHTPPRRSTGNDRTAATAAASTAPMSPASSTGMPARSVSWNALNAPIAAKVPWHNEIWPAIPVMTVIDR